MITKEERIKSEEHLTYIRSLNCTAYSSICNGGIQAHHLLSPWIGSRGMGMKADDRNVIPLCAYHHGILHTQYGSEKSFFAVHARGPNFAKNVAQSLWTDSPSKEREKERSLNYTS